jgi:hypothetical protein
MGKVIVVFILNLFLSALLRLESKVIVAACMDASVIRKHGKFVTNSENSPNHTGVHTYRNNYFRLEPQKGRKKQAQNEDDNYFSHLSPFSSMTATYRWHFNMSCQWFVTQMRNRSFHIFCFVQFALGA